MDHSEAVADDLDLVRSALRSATGFNGIVRKFTPALRRYVVRLLGRQSGTADDVLQEAFVKAYVNLNDFDQTRPFSPWLYRIAHNVAVDFMRRNAATPMVIGGEDGEKLLQGVISDGAILPHPGLKLALQKAFDALTPKYRDVILLRLLEGKSYDEISDILAIPPGTAAIRIKRGLERMQDHLKAWRD